MESEGSAVVVSDECAPRRWCSWGAARFGALIIVPLLVSALVGCGAGSQAGRSEHPTSTATASPASVPTATGTAAATGAGSPLPCPLLTPGPLATVLPGGPAIISANGWSAYTNTAYHFSIQYPANWIVDSPLTTTGPITFLNYDPRQLNGAGLPPPPPYTAIAIDPFPNPSQLSPLEFYHANQNVSPLGPPACSQTTRQLTLAGHAALEIAQKPTQQNGYPPITFPQMRYDVADGTTIVILGEVYSPDGATSPVFAHMLASLTFT